MTLIVLWLTSAAVFFTILVLLFSDSNKPEPVREYKAPPTYVEAPNPKVVPPASP